MTACGNCTVHRNMTQGREDGADVFLWRDETLNKVTSRSLTEALTSPPLLAWRLESPTRYVSLAMLLVCLNGGGNNFTRPHPPLFYKRTTPGVGP